MKNIMNKGFFKSAAIVAPLLLYAPAALAFEITEETQTPIATDEAENSVSNEGAITIDGTPSGNSAAAILIDGSGEDLTLDGIITIRDQDGDGESDGITLENAYGIRLDGVGDFTTDILLQENARIFIDEIAIVDTDSDDDDIVETPTAQTIATRIGLSIENALTGDVRGALGSAIAIDGNGDANNNVRGVSLAATLTGDLELGTLISTIGDGSVGVYIGDTISGLYRQRGAVSVNGAGASAIVIDGAIGQSFQLGATVTARGVAHSASNAGVVDPNLENPDADPRLPYVDLATEKSQSGTAVKITANIGEGVLINGAVNRLVTDAESAALAAIREKRANDEAVTADKTEPYHYDENRRTGSITSYGYSPALEITDGATIGRVSEYLLDTTNDDIDADDALDIFDNNRRFLFSHSLINRGSISALGHNEGEADTDTATALKIGDATLTGGILNMGSIGAEAYNANATAIDIGAAAQIGAVNGAVFLNEGVITAEITSNAITNSDATNRAFAATAVKLSAATLSGGAEFINAGAVAAQSRHLADGADGETQAETGVNAIAFDFENYVGDIALTQRLKVADSLDSDNRYQASGDIDITPPPAPNIVGDILFNNNANILQLEAGEIVGNIYFGGGADALILETDKPDTPPDDYVAPAKMFRGAISKGAGLLDITIGDGAQLHFDGQAGNDPRSRNPETPDDFDGLAVNTLTANDGSELAFSIDINALTSDTAILNVATLTLTDDYKITPMISTVSTQTQSIKLIAASNDLSDYEDTINDHLGGDHPYIYNTSLTIADNELRAIFSIKTAEELGLRPSAVDTWEAVRNYFADGDEVRAQALTSYASSAEAEESFLNDYNSLLPHYGDSVMQQMASFNSTANQSVAQQMALVRMGARGQSDGWIQQYGGNFKRNATDNNDAISMSAYGIGFGYDAPLAGLDIVGLFAQLAYINIDEKTALLRGIKTENYFGGFYAAESFGPVQFELTAQLGNGSAESLRQVRFGALGDVLTGDWHTTTQGGSAKFLLPVQLGSTFWQAELSTEFFEIEQDAYSESELLDSGLAIQLGDVSSALTTASFGIRGGVQFGDDDPIAVKWRPNIYLGYKSISDYEPYEAQAQFANDDAEDNYFTLKNYDEPADRALLGFGLSVSNDYFALEMRYSGSFGEDGDSHTGGLGVRLYF